MTTDFELPPEISAELAELDRRRQEEQERVLRFIERNRGRPTVQRATRWLEFVARDTESCFGDEEAVTYLASRDLPIEKAVHQIEDRWGASAEAVIDRRAAGHPIANFFDGTVRTTKSMPRAEAGRVTGTPSYLLPNFWTPGEGQELHLDAAMLRVVDWCEIGGFDDWWDRYFEEERAFALTEGLDNPVALVYWVAAMARAPLARKKMTETLELRLEAASVSREYNADFPWQLFRPESQPGGSFLTEHYGLASNLAMSTVLLRGGATELSTQAARRLVEVQAPDGSWSTWQFKDYPSIETTACALHALALNEPRGWKRCCHTAADWLVSRQTEGGYWQETAAPDARFLTVLVMDALALTADHPVTTFSRRRSEARSPKIGAAEPRFEVALSFPGEARQLVAAVAQELASQFGKEKILYDDFLESELARPNLDTYLQRLYLQDSRLLVVFLGKDYAAKEWPGLEWRAIREVVKSRDDERVMLVRLDSGDVPGIFSLDGYVSAQEHQPPELAKLMVERHSRL